jgi:hypothetical protein
VITASVGSTVKETVTEIITFASTVYSSATATEFNSDQKSMFGSSQSDSNSVLIGLASAGFVLLILLVLSGLIVQLKTRSFVKSQASSNKPFLSSYGNSSMFENGHMFFTTKRPGEETEQANITRRLSTTEPLINPQLQIYI